MKIKAGVSIRGITPELVLGLMVVRDVLADFTDKGIDLVLTEGTGGQHKVGSLHYVGLAADIRSNIIPKKNQIDVANKMRECLGSEFDVVLEDDHIHVEFQPK